MPILHNVAVALVTKLATWLYDKAMESYQADKLRDKTQAEADAKLKEFKDACKEAFNGYPVSKDQKKRLNKAAKELLKRC
jgi:hypothetical protein